MSPAAAISLMHPLPEFFFFFSSRRRHTRCLSDWSSDVCSSDLLPVKHIMQSTFAGKRIVVFSGGGKKGEDSIFEEARAIRDGGGNGSIIGRNSFQRPKADAIKFLQKVMDIYAGKIQ